MENKSQLASEKIIVALDTSSLDHAEMMLKALHGVIRFYKIGFELFAAHGWRAVELVRHYNGRVFLDLKFHDIPNTVAKAIAVICRHDVDMVNVHALGGFEMMKKVHDMVQSCVELGQKKPLLIGVTVLTSLSDKNLSEELGISHKIQDQVLMLAKMVKNAGLDGVVSSPQ